MHLCKPKSQKSHKSFGAKSLTFLCRRFFERSAMMWRTLLAFCTVQKFNETIYQNSAKKVKGWVKPLSASLSSLISRELPSEWHDDVYEWLEATEDYKQNLVFKLWRSRWRFMHRTALEKMKLPGKYLIAFFMCENFIITKIIWIFQQ